MDDGQGATDDGQQTDDEQRVITIAHQEPVLSEKSSLPGKSGNTTCCEQTH